MDLDNDLVYAVGSTIDPNFSAAAPTSRPIFFKYHEASGEIYSLKTYAGTPGYEMQFFMGCGLAEENSKLAFSSMNAFSLGLLGVEEGEIEK